MVPPAHALLGAGRSTIDRAAQGLAQSPVYVDPRSVDVVGPADAARIVQQIETKDAGPVYIAVLPAAAADAAGGDPAAVLREIRAELGRPGTYAVVVGNQLRAEGALAAARKVNAVTTALLAYVDRVAAARNRTRSSAPIVLVVLGIAALAAGAARKAKSEKRKAS